MVFKSPPCYRRVRDFCLATKGRLAKWVPWLFTQCVWEIRISLMTTTDPDELQLGKLAKKMLAMPPKKRQESKLGKPRNPSQKQKERPASKGTAQENGMVSSTVVSVCPSHAGGELKFVIGIEAQNESLDYLIDIRSAILLAHGLLDYLRPFHLSGSNGTPSADALNPSS